MPTIADVMPVIGEQLARRSWVRRAAPWAGWCVFLVPLTIVLHELGHYSIALWLGFPNPALHYSSVTYGDVTARPASLSGIVGLAGPAVTVILAVFACGWILLHGPARWTFALGGFALCRWSAVYCGQHRDDIGWWPPSASSV